MEKVKVRFSRETGVESGPGEEAAAGVVAAVEQGEDREGGQDEDAPGGEQPGEPRHPAPRGRTASHHPTGAAATPAIT